MQRNRFDVANYILLSSLSILAWSATCGAHEDPFGDLHPWVRVENGDFVVTFANNAEKPRPESLIIEEDKYPAYYTFYRTIISREGKVLAQREPCPEPPILRPDVPLREEEKGIYVKEREGDWLGFPLSSRVHHGKPFMIRLTEGKRQVQQFDWDKNSVANVHGAAASGSDIVFLVSFQSSAGSVTTDPNAFYFCQFTKDGHRCSAPQKIGVPRRIFVYPVCSNVVAQSPRYMVCWVEGQRLVASTWDSSASIMGSQVLQDPVGRNLTISAACLDNVVLVAYGEDGTIKTRMVDLAISRMVQRGGTADEHRSRERPEANR